MSINLTSTFLAAKRSANLVMFSRTVGTTSTPLNGPGGSTACGYPMPLNGRALKLSVYDGSMVRTTTYTIELSVGDRISLYATYINPTFTVSLVLNDGETLLHVTGCAANSVLQATVLLQLEEE